MHRLEDVATIETPEHVELELRLANVGSRATAFVIDFLIQMVVIVIAGIALFVTLDLKAGWSPEERAHGTLPLAVAAVLSLVTFAVNMFYFTFFELVWRGQSPGKRKLGLRVMCASGHPLDARTSLVRNLARIVDLLPSMYALGIVSMFFDAQHRRIGDRAAGTIVVHDPRPVAADEQVDTRRWPAWMTPEERELVGDWLDRRALLPAAQASRVATALARSLTDAHGMLPAENAERFLLELAT